MHKVIFRSHNFETERMMAFAPAVGTKVMFKDKSFIIVGITLNLTDEYWETPIVTALMV